MSLSRLLIVLTTNNKETRHYIHPKHKRHTEKTALANKQTTSWFGMPFTTGQEMEWVLFLQSRSPNGALEPTFYISKQSIVARMHRNKLTK